MKRRKNWTSRHYGSGDYNKSIVVIGQGKTEFRYFRHLKNLFKDKIYIECPKTKTKHSSPNQIVRKIENLVGSSEKVDEAWIVIDHDGRNQSEFQSVIQWVNSNPKNHYAMSNPKFEYWLLLHFEDGNKLSNAKDCTNRLVNQLGISFADKESIKKLEKGTLEKFTCENIQDAIRRAKMRNNGQTSGVLQNFGSTTVHMLAEVICN